MRLQTKLHPYIHPCGWRGVHPPLVTHTRPSQDDKGTSRQVRTRGKGGRVVSDKKICLKSCSTPSPLLFPLSTVYGRGKVALGGWWGSPSRWMYGWMEQFQHQPTMERAQWQLK